MREERGVWDAEEEMESKKDITACAASCGLHARVCGGVRWRGGGGV